MTAPAALRSALFTPGDQPDRVAKALQMPVEAVIVDLEDAVHDDAKATARDNLVALAELPRRPHIRLLVRVNGLRTDFSEADFAAVGLRGVDGVVVPMVETPGDLAAADRLLVDAERNGGLPAGSLDVLALFETAAGMTALSQFVERPERVRQFGFGAGDLALDLGVEWTSDNPALLNAKAQLPLWSRSLGLPKPLDSAYPRVRDADGFRAESIHAAALGYGGKMCIHPGQIQTVHDVFLPTAEQLAKARRIIDAFEAASRAGSAAITVDGEFVDYPVAHRARQLLDASEPR